MLKITSESTSAEPALVEITSEEPVAYSRVLYDDGNLIVVGNLLEYPEEYLQMTRTVYEEVGIEGKEVTSDLRNSFTEMTQVTVYSVSEENPADLSLSRDYYQAGWCRDAAVTESGTLYTVTNKSIYGVNGVTEYLTEVIPVVGTKAELSYLDVNRIYVDDLSSELDSYVVVCGLDLTKADSTLDAVAYLGDQMPVARIAEDGIYLGRTVTGEGEATSRMIRFEDSNLSSVTESENISGLLIPRSFVSLPDTGCAILTGQQECTGGHFGMYCSGAGSESWHCGSSSGTGFAQEDHLGGGSQPDHADPYSRENLSGRFYRTLVTGSQCPGLNGFGNAIKRRLAGDAFFAF